MINIEYRNISKQYQKGTVAVSNVNFMVKNGEFLVLVGPSGCGKSTILRMTAGLEDITNGEIFFDGKLINNVAPKDRKIGMVFQNYALYPHLTVFENIAFPLKIAKENSNYINKRVDEIANIVDLTDFLSRKPKELSGGQRQRVALGRAIARKPNVFLFDEPLSNLDAKLRVQMRTEIINLQKSIGSTAIYVTHDQTEAMTMGERLVVMKDGNIMQIATPSELYNNPDDSFVAGFIGSPQINFFEGEIIFENGIKFKENSNGIEIRLDEKVFKSTPIAQKVTLGIRPENIKITNNSNEYSFNSKITNIEYLGFEMLVYFKTNNNLKCLRCIPNNDLVIDNNYSFELNPNEIKLFNQEGKRI